MLVDARAVTDLAGIHSGTIAPVLVAFMVVARVVHLVDAIVVALFVAVAFILVIVTAVTLAAAAADFIGWLLLGVRGASHTILADLGKYGSCKGVDCEPVLGALLLNTQERILDGEM